MERWTPEFRAWLTAYMVEGDTERTRQLDQLAIAAADRERARVDRDFLADLTTQLHAATRERDVIRIAEQLQGE